eukprot:5145388-Prymnesium_polylepis.1
MRPLPPICLLLLSTARRVASRCERWCGPYTCTQAACSTCVEGCGRPFSPPPPPPAPPKLPHSPMVPLNSVGLRRADYWTQDNAIFTNAFSGRSQQLHIKGASWFGMQGK